VSNNYFSSSRDIVAIKPSKSLETRGFHALAKPDC
jgi:hypothetical protein